MSNPLVSVIIPVYNTEKYLEECVDSVLNQDYKELEIILVDDGSTDGSGTICDGLAAQDERIRIFHQSNSGVSAARNKGIELAKGEFICFVDADDYVPSQDFFPFCKELLDKYEFDERINIICGMNSTGVTNRISDDYLFTIKGSIWGWASWRRVARTWDPKYTWLDDPKTLAHMKEFYRNDKEFEDIIKRAHDRRATGKEYFEYIVGPAAWRDRRLNIVPKYNLISNVGPMVGGVHCGKGIENLPRYTRKLFYMETYNYEFPLIAPRDVKRDLRFEREMTPSEARKKLDQAQLLARLGIKYLFDSTKLLLRGELDVKECLSFIVSKLGWMTYLIYGISNAITSPSLIFGAKRHRGNRIKCAKARVSRLRLRIRGKNNTIVINSLSAVRGCKITITGNNNRIIIGENTRLIRGSRGKLGCSLCISGSDNVITIGNNSLLIDVEIFAEDKENLISIGNKCEVHNKTSLSAIEGTKLTIDDNGLISSDVHIRTGDSHSLLDQSRNRCNPSCDISIGKHVWIGMRSVLLKGAAVAPNSVVAAQSLVTKPFEESGVVIAGSPARIVKRNAGWKYEREPVPEQSQLRGNNE